MNKDYDWKRNRPRISITIEKEVLEKVKELSKRTGKNVSRVIEMCVILGIPRYEQLLGKGYREYHELKRQEKERKEEEENLRDKFLKKVLFSRDEDYRWEQKG